MRIAMIGCKGIPAATSNGGGIESHVEELSTRLVKRGHEVTVYVRPYANLKKRTEWNGVKLVTVPSWNRKNLDAISHTFFSSFHALFGGFDVFHYHGVGPSTLAIIPRIFAPWKKVVTTFHSRDRFHGKWSWIAKCYLSIGEWTAAKFPHATIAVSHAIQVFCRKKFKKHVWYIPNGVQLPTHTPGFSSLASFGLKPHEYFFTLSRLVPHKSIEDAILAFKNVQTEKKLVVIGRASYDDIRYEQRLKHLAEGDSRVMFLGHQTDPTLGQLVSNAYAMIHPSRSEGLSVAVLEAMSYGKVVVMSDIPENLELVDHSGISYKVGDVTALRDIVQWLCDDPTIVADRGERARQRVKTRYSWESVVERTESLYESLLHKRS
jgi:glycosyltransferase involved in cell wall biosynthesis